MVAVRMMNRLETALILNTLANTLQKSKNRADNYCTSKRHHRVRSEVILTRSLVEHGMNEFFFVQLRDYVLFNFNAVSVDIK